MHRELPSTIANGQKLVLILRLRHIIFIYVDSGQKREASEEKPSLAKNSSRDSTVLGREGLNIIIASTEQGGFEGQKTVCACGTHKRAEPAKDHEGGRRVYDNLCLIGNWEAPARANPHGLFLDITSGK